MKRRKVVFDVSYAASKNSSIIYTGIARISLELALELYKKRDSLPFDIAFFVQNIHNMPLSLKTHFRKIYHLPLPRWRMIGRMTEVVPLVEFITGADLIHSPGNATSVCLLNRVVLTIHDTIFLTYPEYHLHRTWKTNLIIRQAHACRAIVTPSESSKRDIVEKIHVPAEKVTVISWGYNAKLFYPEQDSASCSKRLIKNFGITRPYFLSVSCDVKRKNSDKLLNEYIKLLSSNPINDLVLVWQNPPAWIRDLVKKEARVNRIHLLEAVTDAQLRDLYCGATALFCPSSYEGFGLPVLEGMACGVPVVTTKATSLPEVGGDAPLYVSATEPSEWFNAMKNFEDEILDVESMAQKGIKRAMGFSWDKCADQVAELYCKCLGH
ncbi:glycosyltransferase family 4 protein [Candidatus Pacearchaeota archaeon]|nr:glycosyltransferase family 4 protein [Candidatus Pacearchaeota archaeon]